MKVETVPAAPNIQITLSVTEAARFKLYLIACQSQVHANDLDKHITMTDTVDRPCEPNSAESIGVANEFFSKFCRQIKY